MTAVDPDPIGMIADQHRLIGSLLSRLERAAGAPDTVVGDLTGSAIRFLVRAFVAEEIHLHPAMLRQLEGGEMLVERNLSEHDEAEMIMERLLLLKPSDAGFWPAVQRLVGLIRDHFEGDHPHEFGRLHSHGGADDLRRLRDEILSTLDSHPADEIRLPGPNSVGWAGSSEGTVGLIPAQLRGSTAFPGAS